MSSQENQDWSKFLKVKDVLRYCTCKYILVNFYIQNSFIIINWLFKVEIFMVSRLLF